MIYLFPVRVALALIAGLPLVTSYAIDWGIGKFYSNLHIPFSYLYYASLGAFLIVVVFAHYVWKWSSRIQSIYFPYIGGEWDGEIKYIPAAVPDQSQKAAADSAEKIDSQIGQRELTSYCTIKIYHNLLRIKILLDSTESVSETIFVLPRREAGNDQRRIYYIYNNERKLGVANPGFNYRGAASVEIISPKFEILRGDYFTDQKRGGRLRARRKSRHSEWAFWK